MTQALVLLWKWLALRCNLHHRLQGSRHRATTTRQSSLISYNLRQNSLCDGCNSKTTTAPQMTRSQTLKTSPGQCMTEHATSSHYEPAPLHQNESQSCCHTLPTPPQPQSRRRTTRQAHGYQARQDSHGAYHATTPDSFGQETKTSLPAITLPRDWSPAHSWYQQATGLHLTPRSHGAVERSRT